MKMKFYPYKKTLKLYHCVLAAGIPAGPFVFFYDIFHLYNKVPDALFYVLIFLPLGWCAAGLNAVKNIIRMSFCIYTNDEYIKYRFKKILWKELLDVKIINTSYVNELTRVQDDFDRVLRLKDINRKKIYIPFYEHDLNGDNIFKGKQREFESLFRLIEEKAGYEKYSLLPELEKSEDLEKETAHDQTPVWVGWIIAGVYAVLFLFVYVIPALIDMEINELFQEIVLFGYPVAAIALIRIEKKRNWEGFKEIRRILK